MVVKRKQKQLLKVAKANNDGSNVEMELFGEDSWVIVKKQRVTILIPPLPGTKQPAAASDVGAKQFPLLPKEPVANEVPLPATDEVPLPAETHSLRPSVEVQDDPMPVATEISPQVTRKPRTPSHTTSRRERHLGPTVGSKFRHPTHKMEETPGASRGLGWMKLYGKPVCPRDSSLMLSQMMRASNLERKIQRAGGLSRWLASLGLERFIKLFRNRRVDKFQLVNLTMKKLKDMGADAVGPRRKLMHAIDCLCQPHCFEAV